MLIEAIFFEYIHFPLKDVLVIQFQKFLISKINTELLKAIDLKVFEPKNIQNINGKILAQIPISFRLQRFVNFVDDKLKDGIIDSLTKSVGICNAFIFVIRAKGELFQELFFFKEQYLF